MVDKEKIFSNYRLDDIVELTVDGSSEEGRYCEYNIVGYIHRLYDKVIYITQIKSKGISVSNEEIYDIPYERIKDIRLVMPVPEGEIIVR